MHMHTNNNEPPGLGIDESHQQRSDATLTNARSLELPYTTPSN